MSDVQWGGLPPPAPRPFVRLLSAPVVINPTGAPVFVLLGPPERAKIHWLEPPLVSSSCTQPCLKKNCPWCPRRARWQDYVPVTFRPKDLRYQDAASLPAWMRGILPVNPTIANVLIHQPRATRFRAWRVAKLKCETQIELLGLIEDLPANVEVDVRAELDLFWGRTASELGPVLHEEPEGLDQAAGGAG